MEECWDGMGWERGGKEGRKGRKERKGGRKEGREEGREGGRKAHLESTHVDGVECDDEGAVACGELLRVVPLFVGGCAVPEVDGFPEGATLYFKLSLVGFLQSWVWLYR